MSEIIEGHLVDYDTWEYYWNYEKGFFDDDKREDYYNAYLDTPSKQECDEICKSFSGNINIYFKDK